MLRRNMVQNTNLPYGALRFEVHLYHDGLNKHRVIKGRTEEDVTQKADLVAAEWQAKWNTLKRRQGERAERDQSKEMQERKRQEATTRSHKAQADLERLARILSDALAGETVFEWEQLLDKAPFSKKKPTPPKLPSKPARHASPDEPHRNDARFQPDLGFLDRLFTKRRAKKEQESKQRFEVALQEWNATVERLDAEYFSARAAHVQRLSDAETKHAQAERLWVEQQEAFKLAQRASNEPIRQRKKAYVAKESEAIIEYSGRILSHAPALPKFPRKAVCAYDPDSQSLVVDFSLPAPDDLPTLSDVKYVASKDEFIEKHVSESQRLSTYDSVLYQTALSTLHVLFSTDKAQALSTVVFNGYVKSLDSGTGKRVQACILSLRATKEEFAKINLASVDPRACFKTLKGVGSSQLHGLAAVAPILQLRREDRRFVASHSVAGSMSEATNLAAMDWEDFEHLIREVFEKEFSSSGGEVKVTRASRDGGVDAVAFDPDPIRGGKIVIQAKRYTNTVGVSSVRDLYGTVMNEGANKGILVTTSDYGPDAYAFAAGKPLTLLSGSNLLHMLEKHGHRARIDIAEARSLMDHSATKADFVARKLRSDPS